MGAKSRLKKGERSHTVRAEVNVYSEPASSGNENIITQLALGTEVKIMDGPIIDQTSNIYWWKIDPEDIKIINKIQGKAAWIPEFSDAGYLLEPVSEAGFSQPVSLTSADLLSNKSKNSSAETPANESTGAPASLFTVIVSASQVILNLFAKQRGSTNPDISRPVETKTSMQTDVPANVKKDVLMDVHANAASSTETDTPVSKETDIPIPADATTNPKTNLLPDTTVDDTLKANVAERPLIIPHAAKRWCFAPTSVYDVPNGGTLSDIPKYAVVEITGKAPQNIPQQPSMTGAKSVQPSDVQSNLESWIEVNYEKVYQQGKEWLTENITGWVKDACFDEYYEKFPNREVKIPHQTANPNDAQQYMMVDLDEDMLIDTEKLMGVDTDHFGGITSADAVLYNMCGELCIAFIVKEDIDTNADIETVLKKWKTAAKSSFKYSTIADTTNADQLSSILKDAYGYTNLVDGELTLLSSFVKADDINGEITNITHLTEAETTELKIIPSKLSPPLYRSLAPIIMKKMLKTHYLLILARCNLRSEDGPDSQGHYGELIAIDTGLRNHWIVVDKILRNGTRVEIYNPYPNKREEYTYNEFVASCNANNRVTGLWVRRKNIVESFDEQVDDDFTPPLYEVATDNPTSSTEDAEQYIYIEGGSLPKTKLCGEFCTTFILSRSIKAALMSRSKELRNLAGLLQAYGFNTRKKPTNINVDGVKTFSIDTVLKYWKRIQPNLYNSLIGGENNEPTGPDDLITILKAYGYNTPGDYKGESNPLLSSPGSIQKKLEEYFLIVGVNIDGHTGRLKLGNAVPHWVVLTKLTPVGNQRGGNGGWVELYNPFPNSWEEYSFKEFTRAYLGPGLWVKKSIHPIFTPQQLAEAKVKEKKAVKVDKKGNKPGKGNQKQDKDAGEKIWSSERMQREIKTRLSSGKTPDQILPYLTNASGWKREDVRKLLPGGKKIESNVDINKLMSDLGAVSYPPEIGKWIEETARGDAYFAEELAYALRESGILVIENNQAQVLDLEDVSFLNALKNDNLPDAIQTTLKNQFNPSVFVSQLVYDIASNVLFDFTKQSIEGIKEKKHELDNLMPPV